MRRWWVLQRRPRSLWFFSFPWHVNLVFNWSFIGHICTSVNLHLFCWHHSHLTSCLQSSQPVSLYLFHLQKTSVQFQTMKCFSIWEKRFVQTDSLAHYLEMNTSQKEMTWFIHERLLRISLTCSLAMPRPWNKLKCCSWVKSCVLFVWGVFTANSLAPTIGDWVLLFTCATLHFFRNPKSFLLFLPVVPGGDECSLSKWFGRRQQEPQWRRNFAQLLANVVQLVWKLVSIDQ